MIEVALAPFLDPGSRTFWPGLVAFAVVAIGWHGGRDLVGALALRLWAHPSARLDLALLATRQLLAWITRGLGAGAALGWARALSLALDHTFGVPSTPAVPWLALSIGYTLTLFVAWDASRWALHRWMHTSPTLWQLHQLHHSAEVLTPLTFHRVHPIEGWLYELRGVVVSGTLAGLAFWLFRGAASEWTVLGVHGLGLVANVATGNLRHSHVWLRFPPAVERWLLSPAQHQLHHGDEPGLRNLGTWLACWDRWTGTLALAGPTPPRFGLPAGERNHGDSLGSALLDPVGAAARVGLGRWGWLAVLWPGGARAEPPPAVEEEQDPYEIVVVGVDGIPRVAGSAHVVDEAELERFSYDDVQKVLAKIPGVYVRGEDGFGLRPNIGMRGGNSDRSAKVSLMQDGVPLAPAPYAAPAAYYFPLMDRIVGVEVFKGPASIRFGPQTIGGAVNLRTRPIPDALHGGVEAELGRFTTTSAHGWTGATTGRLGWSIEGAHRSSNGFKTLDGGGPTGFSRQDALLKLGFDRTVLAVGVGRERSSETYLGLSAGDFDATPYRRYAASSLDQMAWLHTEERLSTAIDLGPVDVTAVGYHQWLARRWTKLNGFAGGPDLHDLLLLGGDGQSAVYQAILEGEADSATADQALQIGTNDRTFHAGGATAEARWCAGGDRVRSEAVAGVRLHADDVVRIHTEDPFAMTGGAPSPTGGPTTTTLDAHTSALALALWASDDLSAGPVHLLPGARLEVIRTASGTTTTGPVDPETRVVGLPGLGALVGPSPWLDLFAGVHRGFSPVAPGSAPDTLPETAWNGELGARAGQGSAHAELVGFVSDYRNIVGQCTLSGGCSDAQLDQQFNGGAARVGGLEALAAYEWLLPGGFALGVGATWTFTDARFRTGFVSEYPQWGAVEPGERLPYVPTHQGAVNVGLEHPRVGVALAATGRGPMWDTASDDGTPEVPGAVVVDLVSRVSPTDAVAITLGVTNLFDVVTLESWRPFGARPGAPRQLTAGVRVER